MHASLVYKIADAILEASQEKPFNEREYQLEEEQVGTSAFVAATIEKEKPPTPKVESDVKRLLTEYRTKKARELEVKPYHILSNRTLKLILEKMPQTTEQLLEVDGIGLKKAVEYGRDILSILHLKKVVEFQESPKVSTPLKVQEENLRSLLTEYRRTRAQELGVKPYYIYTNKTLDAILEQKLKTIKALLEIDGIRAKKAEEFGERIVSIFNKDA